MIYLAGGPGFEPRLTESESAVLPLNYPPTGARAREQAASIAKRARSRKRFAHVSRVRLAWTEAKPSSRASRRAEAATVDSHVPPGSDPGVLAMAIPPRTPSGALPNSHK